MKNVFKVQQILSICLIFSNYIFAFHLANTITDEKSLKEKSKNASENYIGTATLIYDSEACQCIREKGEEIQRSLRKIITDNPNYCRFIKVQEIDYSTHQDQANSVLSTCTYKFLPVLVLRYDNDLLFYECSYEYNEHEFREALEELISIVKTDLRSAP